MKKLLITGLALGSATLAACSENPITGVSADPLSPMMATVTTPASQRVCSEAVAGNGGFVVTSKNPGWQTAIDPDGAGPLTGSYVGPTAGSSTNFTPGSVNPSSYGTYLAKFTLPSNASAISISGNVLVDNDVTIAVNGQPRFFSTFPGTGNPGDWTYPAGNPDNRTLPNFQTPGGLAFGTGTGFTTGDNTVSFTVYNDNNPNTDLRADHQDTNPTGLSFCFTVNYTLTTTTPDTRALFVIGDVEPHAIGNVVNFWGSQWWKNNFMSGTVSSGVASFKGYASTVDGCTWTALPGNSGNPPAVIPDDVLIIVTSKVIKKGNNISGDIVQYVTVHHDGKYDDNPGHHGGGAVISTSACGVTP